MNIPPIVSGRRKRLLGRLVVNGLAQAAAAIGTAMLIKLAFDRLISTGEPVPQPLILMAWIALGLVLAAACIGWLRMRELTDAERMAQDYIFEVRMMLFERLSSLSPRTMQRRSRGGVMLRFVGDLNALRQWAALGLGRLIVAGVAGVAALSALAVVNWVLALAAGVVLISSALIAFALGKRLHKAVKESRRRTVRIAANVNEQIASMQVVQLFNRSDREHSRIERQNLQLKDAMVNRARIRGLLRALTEGATALATGSVLLLGIAEVLFGNASPGTVVAAMIIVGLLASPMRDLGRVYEYWHGARVSQLKISTFLALPPLGAGAEDAPNLQSGPSQVEFDGVSLAGALNDFTATVPAGSVVALVGPNGAGKTTLLSLLARLIDPDQGSILLDGQDIAAHSLKSLRRRVSMVSPDLNLMRGSISKNIRYRWHNAPDDELTRVCALCGIDEMVSRLPEGLATRVTEGGGNLSPGQRSRIALARALLGQPSVLLLDEAESNLDPIAYAAFDRVLAQYEGTVILVTHRPERLANVDLIWHLQAGELIEAGPPAQVLIANGPTAKLFGSGGSNDVPLSEATS